MDISNFFQAAAVGGCVYYLRTEADLVVRNEAGYLALSSHKYQSHNCPVLLYIPRCNDSFGFLFSSRGWNNLIVLPPILSEKTIIPVRLHRKDHNQTYLIDQRTMSYVTIHFDDAKSALKMLSATSRSISSIQPLELTRADLCIKSPSMRRSLRGINRIAAYLERSLSGYRSMQRETLIKRVSKLFNDADSNIIDYCMVYFSRELYEEIASLVLSKDIDVPRSLSHDSQDIFLQDSLHRYAKKVVGDFSGYESTKAIGPDLDRLDTIGYNGCFNSFGHCLNFCARYIADHYKYACIVTSARNEGLYLIDWVSYHRSIGFEQIFVYSNDNEDGSDDILQILANANYIIWVRNITGEYCRPQAKAYGHAFGLSDEVIRYRWTAVIDLDEFIVLDPSEFNGLKNFLTVHEDRGSDVIHLNWNMMTSCKKVKYDPRPVFERFNFRTVDANMHTKCIFKTKIAMHSSPHYPIIPSWQPVKHVNADGSSFNSTINMALSDTPMIKPACVNHYYYKSKEEFVVKFSRSRGFDMIDKKLTRTVPEDLAKDFHNQFISDDIIIDETILSNIDKFNSYHSQIFNLPGMRESFERCQRWYTTHLKTLNTDFAE